MHYSMMSATTLWIAESLNRDYLMLIRYVPRRYMFLFKEVPWGITQLPGMESVRQNNKTCYYCGRAPWRTDVLGDATIGEYDLTKEGGLYLQYLIDRRKLETRFEVELSTEFSQINPTNGYTVTVIPPSQFTRSCVCYKCAEREGFLKVDEEFDQIYCFDDKETKVSTRRKQCKSARNNKVNN